MQSDLEVVMNHKARISCDLKTFVDLMPIVVMDNKDDEIMLKYLLTMADSVANDLDNARSIQDLRHVLDVRKFVNACRNGVFNSSNDASFLVDMQEEILKSYGIYEDESGELTEV